MDNLDSYIENIANEILKWCELNIITLYNQNKLTVIDNIKNNNNDTDNSNIDDYNISYSKIVTTKGLGFKLLECKDKFPIYSPHILTLACTKLIEKNNIYLDVTSRRVINYLYHDNELNKIINKYIHSQSSVSAADDNTNTSKQQKDRVTHTTTNTTAVMTMKKHTHTTDLTATAKMNINVNAKQKNTSNNNDEDKSLALMTKKMKIDNKANNGVKITSFFSLSQSKINNNNNDDDDDDNVKGRGNDRSYDGRVNLASSYGTTGSSSNSSSRSSCSSSTNGCIRRDVDHGGVVIVENQENHNPLQTITNNNNKNNNTTSKSAATIASTTASTTFTKTAALTSLSHSTSMLSSKSNTKLLKQSVPVQDTISKVKMFIPTVVNIDLHVDNNDRHSNNDSSNSSSTSTSLIHRNDMKMLKHIISSLLSSSLNKKQDEVHIQQLASEVSSTSWTSSHDGSSVVGISKGQLDIILDCFEQENLIMRDGDLLYIL
jgi:hypothetical protein